MSQMGDDAKVLADTKREVNKISKQASEKFWTNYRHMQRQQKRLLNAETHTRKDIGSLIKTVQNDHIRQVAEVSKNLTGGPIQTTQHVAPDTHSHEEKKP